MDLIAWRTVGKNPCTNPPVYISIGMKGLVIGVWVWPWALPLDRAREMFGEIVDQIGEEPVPVSLTLTLS